MVDSSDLHAKAEDLLNVMPRDRAEAMVFSLGFLDQAVRSYLSGEMSREDLTYSRDLIELTLDLHLDREGRFTC